MSLRRRRGVNMIEILVALFVAIFALFTLTRVFSVNYKYSTMSRNRSAATILAHSLMDEVEAHPYGTATPPSWKVSDERPIGVWIQGQPQDMLFHKKIEFGGGFDGSKPAEMKDLVTITLTWREGVGVDEVSNSEDDHKLVVTVPVWR
jgi:hypothetical protein